MPSGRAGPREQGGRRNSLSLHLSALPSVLCCLHSQANSPLTVASSSSGLRLSQLGDPIAKGVPLPHCLGRTPPWLSLVRLVSWSHFSTVTWSARWKVLVSQARVMGPPLETAGGLRPINRPRVGDHFGCHNWKREWMLGHCHQCPRHHPQRTGYQELKMYTHLLTLVRWAQAQRSW